jgi:glycosyltransferase involved in cell wall biosynthesis
MNTQKNNRTAFVIHSLGIGGSEKFFVALVNGFQKAGLQPLVILLERDNPMLPELDTSVETVVMARKFKYDLSVSLRIRALLKRRDIGKVFCVEPYAFFLAQLGYLVGERPVFFLSLHNSIPTGLKKFLLDLSYLRFIRRRDMALFICRYQREYFSRTYKFSPSRSCVVYNGIDTDHFSPCKARELPSALHCWREQRGIGPADQVLLTVGRISPEKSQADAVRALRRLHDLGSANTHLVIVGAGSAGLVDALRSLVKELALTNHVHLAGAQKEVRHYLLHADAFVLTSVSETFSLAALEAMSMGLPCILTRIGGAEEMITDDVVGELCEAGDPDSIASAWQRMLAKQRDRKMIRSRTIQLFSQQKMIDHYLKLVQ